MVALRWEMPTAGRATMNESEQTRNIFYASASFFDVRKTTIPEQPELIQQFRQQKCFQPISF
jgi:hypothetical protein